MPYYDSERFVMDLFLRRFGLGLTKVPETKCPMPDFEFVRDNQRLFVAELKDIEHQPMSEKAGWTLPGPDDECPVAHRTDNAVRRVANKIHDAFKQLGNFTCPRVLIFLNHDSMVDEKDLMEAFTGQLPYSNGVITVINTVSKGIANGRIREEKTQIDLYIWIQKENDKVFFRYPTQAGCDLVRDLFPGVDRGAEINRDVTGRTRKP
jgi:hypothetical protein